MTNPNRLSKPPSFAKRSSPRQVNEPTGLIRGANMLDAAEHNKKLVLQTIRADGPITRPEIAELTGLTAPSIYTITKGLLDRDLLRGVGRTSGERGQPATPLTVNPGGAFSLGLNVDRDHITLVVLDFAGHQRATFSQEIKFALPDYVRQFVSDSLAEVVNAGLIPKNKIAGIGVALPDDLGRVRLPGQPDAFSAWTEVTAGTFLADITDIPVRVENDAAAAAIGEMHFGGGLESDSFFYVLISAGLGGGLVINRHYVRGAHGRSGEIGFLPKVNPFRPRRSDLRHTVGDTVLLSDLYDDLYEQGVLARSPADLAALPPAQLHLADPWVESVADHLYLPILTLFCGIDPDAIYIGGRLPPVLLDRLCLALNSRLSLNLDVAWSKMIVRPARLGENPAAVGAAILSFEGLWQQGER